MIGPWNLTGGRFVATRDCKARRRPDELARLVHGALLDAGRQVHGVGRVGGRPGGWLHKNGRMFQERDHIHTQMYKFRGAVAADPDPVPPELALDHRYPGVVVVFGEVDEGVDPVVGGARPAVGWPVRRRHAPAAAEGAGRRPPGRGLGPAVRPPLFRRRATRSRRGTATSRRRIGEPARASPSPRRSWPRSPAPTPIPTSSGEPPPAAGCADGDGRSAPAHDRRR